MANIALVTADRVRVEESLVQLTLVAGEDITAGEAVRIDTTTGRFTGSNGTSAGEARIYGIAAKSVKSGMAVTAIRHGVMAGFDLTAQAYDKAIFLSDTDGKLADAAGTTSVVVGRVLPVNTQLLGSNPDKLLYVHITA
jgi:hypothetical protein